MKKKSWLIAGLAVVVVAGGTFLLLSQKSGRSQKVALKEVLAERGDMKVTIQATGGVEPKNKVVILPPVAGRVDKILVDEGMTVKSGQVIAWMSSTNRAALLDFAMTKSKEEVKKLEEAYLPTPVIAPVTGLIVKKSVVSGQTVNQTTTLFEMSDILIVRAQVDETDISKIKMGMVAEVTVDAYPGNVFRAEVTKIAHQSDLVNNVNIYSVELTLIKKDAQLRSGMTANIDFILEEKNDVIRLPVWALSGSDGKRADVFNADGTIRHLTLGISDGKFAEVTAGVTENEKVFVKPLKIDQDQLGKSPFMPSGRRPGGGGR